MKRLKKFGLWLLSVFLMLTGMLLLPADAAESRLFDEGNLLTAAEKSECEARLEQASAATGMNVAVVIGVKERSDLTIESTCKETYRELFGSRTDGLLYYMDMKGHAPYDYIITSGKGRFYYTNGSSSNRISDMHSQLDAYLYPIGSENVSGAVIHFAELTELYYQEGVPQHYYVYDDEDRMYYYMENGEVIATVTQPFHNAGIFGMSIFIGAVAGLLIGLLVFASVKNAYKFKFEMSPTTYVNRKNVNYVQQYDNFVRTSTSRVHIESSGSRGGGHHGGGHSSGGFGGGGHHR